MCAAAKFQWTEEKKTPNNPSLFDTLPAINVAK